ncbi:MAG: ATP phosphoribosyltransferase regulatory subunit [Clostridiales bacterium]|jgi:ATP phosphoribosyltransferase regulatory subunit|nr:ATP phosphoribosyltransferase regulatory subunit [Clostridiales bacterium]
MQKYKIPGGMCDYLPDECYMKNLVEDKILAVFKSDGYERIETPSVEYHGVFAYNGVFPIENAFKTTDTDGNLLILRPDITMPLSRIVSTKMNPVFPLKLCYLGNSFSLLADEYRYREFTQAGLELIGEKSYLADAEVIILAIEALKAAGLDDFLIELGNTEFLRGLIYECGLDERGEAELIKSVGKKNNFAITEILGRAGVSAELSAVITELPTLFGEDAAEKARRLTAGNKRSGDALDELERIYGLLAALGYEKYISIDLGLLNSMNFYTGTVFKGISLHFGAAILSGGRYDDLFTDKGGAAIPATGFAVGIKNLLTALAGNGKILSKPPCDCVIGGRREHAVEAFKKKTELKARGFTVSYTFIDDEIKLKKYADAVGAKRSVFIDKRR